MRHKIITLTLLAIAVIVLLGACAPTRITAQNIRASVKTLAFKTGHGTALHSNLRMTLLEPPEKNVHFYAFLFGDQRNFSVGVAAGCNKAAQAVFGRIGSISGETTFSPHLIARIKKVSCSQGTFAKNVTCMASMDLYWGGGGFIRTYKAKAIKSNFTYNNSLYNGIYNSYVKIFESITKQMLSDQSLAPYFDHGFDDSPASAILAQARSRGYASENEIKSALSLRSDPLNLMNAFILDSLLPFSRERDQALEQGNIRRVQSVSRHWRSWLKQCQGHVSQKAENSIKKQLAYLDKLDSQFNDPILGKLTMKFAKAIKQERWQDAKNIQSLILGMRHSKSMAVQTDHSSQDQSGGGDEKCEQAKQDYSQTVAAYKAAKNTRDTSNNEATGASIGALGYKGTAALLLGLVANTTRNDANTAQNDMNHALRLMLDAKERMTVYCGN